MAENKRYVFVDNVRGLAMLVIISWHIHNAHSPWTEAWTMPIFFVIMGFFYKHVDLKTLIQKKVLTLVVPLLFFSIPDVWISLFQDGLLRTGLLLLNPYKCIHGGSWFVWCTLWIYALAFIMESFRRFWLRCALVVVCLLVGYVVCDVHLMGHRVVLPLYSSSAAAMFIFFSLGMASREKIFAMGKKTTLVIALGGMGFITLDIFYMGGVILCDIMWCDWQQNPLLLVLRSAMACLIVLACCKLMPRIPVVAYMGEYSLVVLLSHFYFIDLFRIWLPYGWLLFFLVVACTLAFTWLSTRFFPLLVGAKKICQIQ